MSPSVSKVRAWREWQLWHFNVVVRGIFLVKPTLSLTNKMWQTPTPKTKEQVQETLNPCNLCVCLR